MSENSLIKLFTRSPRANIHFIICIGNLFLLWAARTKWKNVESHGKAEGLPSMFAEILHKMCAQNPCSMWSFQMQNKHLPMLTNCTCWIFWCSRHHENNHHCGYDNFTGIQAYEKGWVVSQFRQLLLQSYIHAQVKGERYIEEWIDQLPLKMHQRFTLSGRNVKVARKYLLHIAEKGIVLDTHVFLTIPPANAVQWLHVDCKTPVSSGSENPTQAI